MTLTPLDLVQDALTRTIEMTASERRRAYCAAHGISRSACDKPGPHYQWWSRCGRKKIHRTREAAQAAIDTHPDPTDKDIARTYKCPYGPGVHYHWGHSELPETAIDGIWTFEDSKEVERYV